MGEPGREDSLHARLAAIRERLERLVVLDRRLAVFGASRHEWKCLPVMDDASLDAFEQAHGVTLPMEVRGFFATVSGGGAGPYYGLVPLVDAGEDAALAEAFAFDVANALEADALARDPRRVGGYLVLADQGCGYQSVLVLQGPRRGMVLADMREAHEGFVAEAADFLEWYEGWLDDALVAWAMSELPELIAVSPAERAEEVVSAITAAGPLLEQRADPAFAGPRDALYPPAPPAERLRSLLYLHAFHRRFAEAEALVDRVRDLDQRDREAAKMLTLARLAAAMDDQARRLELADRGARTEGIWHATRTSLLQQKVDALVALDRRREASEVALERARHAGELFAYYDAAWLFVEDGELDRAASTLVDAVRFGCFDDPEGTEGEPLSARTLRAAEGFFDALEGAGRGGTIDGLRARLRSARDLDA